MTDETNEPQAPLADVKLADAVVAVPAADAVIAVPADNEANKAERSQWHAGGGSALEPLADYHPPATSETPEASLATPAEPVLVDGQP